MLLISALAGGPDQIKDQLGTMAPQFNQKIRADADFGKVPLYFIPNKGQLNERVAYYVQGKDKTVYFTSEGITFALNSLAPAKESPSQVSLRDLTADNWDARKQAQNSALQKATSGAASAREADTGRWIVKLDFVGANPEARPSGQDETGAVISYFRGQPEDWHAGIRPIRGSSIPTSGRASTWHITARSTS